MAIVLTQLVKAGKLNAIYLNLVTMLPIQQSRLVYNTIMDAQLMERSVLHLVPVSNIKRQDA
jgi:hypothetical protein